MRLLCNQKKSLNQCSLLVLPPAPIQRFQLLFEFLNLVISGNCSLSYEALNKELKSIEDDANRNREAPKFSSRTLDIDIVLQISDEEEIIFESDEIAKYHFVSEPLKELL